ncbi:hypothetical protein Tco_0311485 [Tanacetum coccineum]
MKEQAYNIIKTKDSRTQRQSNHKKFMEARFKISPQKFEDQTLGEIVSLKYVYEHKSSESTGSLAFRKIRIERIKDEMCGLRHDVIGLRGVVESFTTEQSRVSTWLISCMTQLMDASGHTYQEFDSTLVGSLRMPYQRRIRPRTGDANTSTRLAKKNVCEEEVPLNNNIGKQIGDFVDMHSKALEQGMDANVPDEIDGAKGEQVPNNVV